MSKVEKAAMAACEAEHWIDMRDDPESESTFFNHKSERFEFSCETWKELAEQEHICYRIGWRYFKCPECGNEWLLPTRDCFSPSGEDCKCGEFASPYKSKQDLSLPHDDYCNLTCFK